MRLQMVRERAWLALLGASGSGKSTLLNLIAGLDRPDAGAIVVDGHDLATMTGEQLAQYRRHTVGMVFQSFNLVPTMTLYENVELPMRFAEVRRKERRSRVEDALQKVGLAGRAEHRPSEMSGGEQQRAAIARALVNQPKILLADEPTGNLDSKTGTEIMDLIAELNRTLEMTVIMVTHERALADRYADRMVFLADGKVQGVTQNLQKGAAR
jgi:putative ABC transport system ATP-binding protein